MVIDFWGVETRGAGPRACMASTRLWRGVDSRRCTCELGVNGARGGTYNHHGVMLKVELIEGLRRKCTESQSLFSGKKRGTRSLDWSQVV